jgi:hypothetical protein
MSATLFVEKKGAAYTMAKLKEAPFSEESDSKSFLTYFGRYLMQLVGA